MMKERALGRACGRKDRHAGKAQAPARRGGGLDPAGGLDRAIPTSERMRKDLEDEDD
jgi:hypothetical protein